MMRSRNRVAWLQQAWKLLVLILLMGPLMFAVVVLLPYGPGADWGIGAAERWQVAMLAAVWAVLFGILLWVVGKAMAYRSGRQDRAPH